MTFLTPMAMHGLYKFTVYLNEDSALMPVWATPAFVGTLICLAVVAVRYSGTMRSASDASPTRMKTLLWTALAFSLILVGPIVAINADPVDTSETYRKFAYAGAVISVFFGGMFYHHSRAGRP